MALRSCPSELLRLSCSAAVLDAYWSDRRIADCSRTERAAASGSSRRSLIRLCAAILLFCWFSCHSCRRR